MFGLVQEAGLISANRRLTFRVSSYQIYLHCVSRDMNGVCLGLVEYLFRSALSMFTACRPPRAVSLSFWAVKSAISQPPISRNASSIRRCSHDTSSLLEIARTQRRPGCTSEQKIFPKPRRRFSSSPVAMHGHIDPPKPGEE